MVGKPVAQAEQILTAEGLVIGTTTNQANPAAPGTVVRTDPPAGTHVSKKAVVNLVVSVGEAHGQGARAWWATTWRPPRRCSRNDGLNYKVKFVTSNGQQNIVLSQDPAAGTVVRHGNTVTISVPKPDQPGDRCRTWSA